MILRDHGITVLPDLISQAMREGLQVEGRHEIAPVRRHETENGWRVNVTPARVTRENRWDCYSHARAFIDLMRPYANSYLGLKWGINQLIWDYSEPTTKPLFPHHVDDFKGHKALKAYVYLTDTTPANSPLEYAIGSHISVAAGGSHITDRPTNFNGAAGTVILFDPAGLHGSGRLIQGSRYIFRVHFVEASYVRRYLPDQLPWYQRPLARVLAKVSP
jgi:hypothetical protein